MEENTKKGILYVLVIWVIASLFMLIIAYNPAKVLMVFISVFVLLFYSLEMYPQFFPKI